MMSRNNKKVVIYIVIATLAILLLSLCFSYYLSMQYKLNFTNFTADVLYNIEQKYSLSEKDIVKDIFTKNTKLDKNVLNKYGIDNTNIDYLGYSKKVVISFVSLTIILVFLFLFVIIRYIKNQNKKIDNISKYLDQILNEEYNLEITDNDESSISILKNKIYDITVMLKEKNKLLSKDKQDMLNLISDISHQIKTPLTSLNLLINLLYDDNITIDQKQKFLDEMSRQVNKIQWLIKNILDIAKIDSKTLVFKKQSTNAFKMLNKCINNFEVLANIQNVTINLTECSRDIFLNIDEKWMSEALENIIKNAIEHKAKIIDIACTQNRLYTKISIKDNGEGISSKDLPHIFERFYKAQNSNSSSLGLGLAFCKSVINAQNGYIKVKSKVDLGTEFNIKIYKEIV